MESYCTAKPSFISIGQIFMTIHFSLKTNKQKKAKYKKINKTACYCDNHVQYILSEHNNMILFRLHLFQKHKTSSESRLSANPHSPALQWNYTNPNFMKKMRKKIKAVFFSPGHKCTHDPLLILYCSSLVELSESNPLQCQMRPIMSPTNQWFPATEPTSNSLIQNKASVNVR